MRDGGGLPGREMRRDLVGGGEEGHISPSPPGVVARLPVIFFHPLPLSSFPRLGMLVTSVCEMPRRSPPAPTLPLSLHSHTLLLEEWEKKRRFLGVYVAQMPDMQAWEVTDEGERRKKKVQRKSRVVDSASGDCWWWWWFRGGLMVERVVSHADSD